MNRRHFLRQTSAGLGAALSSVGIFQVAAAVDRRSRLEHLMAQLHERRRFTGEILVAEKGQIIYAGAFGFADPATGRPYTTNTRSCLASLSKPITAVVTMMLAERRLLRYDDPLSKFLPGFSDAMAAVTIPSSADAHLGDSGLPDAECRSSRYHQRGDRRGASAAAEPVVPAGPEIFV